MRTVPLRERPAAPGHRQPLPARRRRRRRPPPQPLSGSVVVGDDRKGDNGDAPRPFNVQDGGTAVAASAEALSDGWGGREEGEGAENVVATTMAMTENGNRRPQRRRRKKAIMKGAARPSATATVTASSSYANASIGRDSDRSGAAMAASEPPTNSPATPLLSGGDGGRGDKRGSVVATATTTEEEPEPEPPTAAAWRHQRRRESDDDLPLRRRRRILATDVDDGFGNVDVDPACSAVSSPSLAASMSKRRRERRRRAYGKHRDDDAGAAADAADAAAGSPAKSEPPIPSFGLLELARRRAAADARRRRASSDATVPTLIGWREMGASRGLHLGRRLSLSSSYRVCSEDGGNRVAATPATVLAVDGISRDDGGGNAAWRSLLLKRRRSRRGGIESPRRPLNRRQLGGTNGSCSGCLRNGGGSGVWEWRPYAFRSMPFSILETPWTDAILSLDRYGSYLIGLGGGDGGRRREEGEEENEYGLEARQRRLRLRPVLSLRFYGVPSPSKLEWRRMHCTISSTVGAVSPLVTTVPLLLENGDFDDNRNFTAPSSVLGGGEGCPAASTPVQILISRDSAMGVAFLHHSSSSTANEPVVPPSSLVSSPAIRDEDTLGTLIIFPLPLAVLSSDRPNRMKTYKCANVRVGGWKASTMRNLLWPATHIPHRTDEALVMDLDATFGYSLGNNETTAASDVVCTDHAVPLWDSFIRVPSAYMLFNDEDDGYRITWIVNCDSFNSEIVDASSLHSAFCTQAHSETAGMARLSRMRPTRHDIVTLSQEKTWEQVTSDVVSGCAIAGSPGEAVNNDLDVSFEVYLHVDALLSDVLRRRKLMSSTPETMESSHHVHMPDFFYNLVSAASDEVPIACLVVVFSNIAQKRKAGPDGKKIPAALGVFLEVNLFDQSYLELQWVQHPSRFDSKFLQQWSNTLALHRRMQERRIGWFSCRSGTLFHGSSVETHECNCGREEESDADPAIWGPYLKEKAASPRSGKKLEPPKSISMSSLYPFCDIITNRAVVSRQPIESMICRSGATELRYG